MNITLENILTGIVKPRGGFIGKGQKVEETEFRPDEASASVQHREGEIPIGLGVVPIIPTGSVFIPRELVIPEAKEPLEVDVVLVDHTALIPQKAEEVSTKTQKTGNEPVNEQKKNTEITAPTAAEKNNHTIDIMA